MTLFVSGIISIRLYFARKYIKADSLAQTHGYHQENSKGLRKCFPYVNQWAQSVFDLISLYVSTRKYPLRGYILGVLTHTTAWDRYWRGDETLDWVNKKIVVGWPEGGPKGTPKGCQKKLVPALFWSTRAHQTFFALIFSMIPRGFPT